jgi:hypothetical protein
MPAYVRCVGAIALMAALAGCVTTANDRLTEGHGPAAYQPEALTRESGRAGRLDPPPPVAKSSPASLAGLDRSNWTPTPVVTPVDGVAHHPLYTQHLILTDATARQRREYPTAETALELTQGSGEAQAWEAPRQHLEAFRDLLLGLPRLFWQAPWRVRWSPDESYARIWTPAKRPGAATPASASSAPDQDQAFAEPKPVRITP